MRIIEASDARAVTRLVERDAVRDPAVERMAARIIRDVRRRGDRAVRDWTRRFQSSAERRAPGAAFEVSRHELDLGWQATPPAVRRAIRTALDHIEAVAAKQRPVPFELEVAPGVVIEQRVQPLARVGCYVPGGRFPLPSTLLMTAIPARMAGVPDITVVCPRPEPAVLAAALEAGVTRVLRVGGAQAIAALAYGTKSIARVDKIVGPGNAWVAAAKSLVSADCAIDFNAGPSEIVVCSDTGRPDWIAADLLAQAEHDPAARALLVTTKRRLAGAVAAAVRSQMPREGAARTAIRRNGAVIIARNRRQAVDLVNRIAPEHLVCDDDADVSEFTSAGTIFAGQWSAQAGGDYCTGSNHVLPTGGAARLRGGLSTADFVRVFTVQRLTEHGLQSIGPDVVALARAEGLAMHALSVTRRMGQ
jgi:histidinol dehydrogenase